MLEKFASPEECAALQKRMDQLLQDFDPQTVSIFSTKNQVSTSLGRGVAAAGDTVGWRRSGLLRAA